MIRKAILAATLMLALPAAARAQGAGSLNLYCSATLEWCQPIARGFERETGIRVSLTQKSTGEMLAQLRAEARNPRGDVWWGGTGDPHVAAGEEGLTEPHESPRISELHDWAQAQWRQTRGRTVGVYASVLGFGFNTELVARRDLPAPRCWADLLNPAYKGELQMANPNSSGTAYIVIATLVQMMGEEPAFEYLKKLHGSINAYPRSGTAPITAVARGETALSISFVHNAAEEAQAGFPVGHAVPCEGTGYEIGSMSIIKGARNAGNARRFYHWALGAEAQITASREAKKLQTMSNKGVPLTDGAPNMATARIIDYDNARFGASVERRRLLARWDKEVGALPR
ncbi:iron ABC transporter substrate-binding protein [Pseudoroseomonas rhizosphaerae]|uniref:Iron ABC transporter substrate-binding protein n=1 Tax=Teichococcus rhizosphaerae TaxID=1335062 RepID=A0A2C7A8Z1_9PROT|nr:ABC transporter substrate-binding protein [Pseudoroseomonas rhizosphaerae]PHK93506.1 iron ABC transporter substrate-binding protein [Pseudoroseomonas rhizosphaerae]